MLRATAIVVTIVLCGLRYYGVTHPAYQAVAHVWVGMLLGAWLVGRRTLWLVLFVVLCVVELSMVFLS